MTDAVKRDTILAKIVLYFSVRHFKGAQSLYFEFFVFGHTQNYLLTEGNLKIVFNKIEEHQRHNNNNNNYYYVLNNF